MDMRSSRGVSPQTGPGATAGPAARVQSPARARPIMLLVAAAAQAAEAVLLLVAAVLTAVDAAAGQSYQRSSGVALIVLEFIVVAGLAWIASGLARVRPWSRTPAAMIQVFTGIVAIYLLQAHRFDWGVIALLLALAGLAGLLTPASLRALNRPTVNRRS
ncbi:MAG TPA: hypothetical protein VF482_07855 [Trebonia sp.]